MQHSHLQRVLCAEKVLFYFKFQLSDFSVELKTTATTARISYEHIGSSTTAYFMSAVLLLINCSIIFAFHY